MDAPAGPPAEVSAPAAETSAEVAGAAGEVTGGVLAGDGAGTGAGEAPPAATSSRRRRSRSRGGTEAPAAAAAPGGAGAPAAARPEGAAAGSGPAAEPPAPASATGEAQPQRPRRRRTRGGAAAPGVSAEAAAARADGAAAEAGPPAAAEAGPLPQAPVLTSALPLPEPLEGPELSPEEQEGLDRLASRLQIRFRRPALLREAMTHASWNNERGEASGPGHDNERLEYLGDAVLELVVGEHLFRRFPGYDEGQLTQLRAALVNTVSLAKLAERLDLGDALLLGKGADKTGARRLPSLLANCFEAMIGAIFLDQGYRVATRVFLQSIGDLAEWTDQNHKGKLQEVAQLRRGATPSYRVVSTGGPGHRREYRAEALVGGDVLGEGRGRTKQSAEQEAARVALERLAAAGAPAKAARPRRISQAAEPARVRRRVAEVAADRRAAVRGRDAPRLLTEAGDAGARPRGLLGALRAAAGAVLGRHPRDGEPAPAATPGEGAAEAAGATRRRTRRGHRGGRGRKRPSPPASSGT